MNSNQTNIFLGSNLHVSCIFWFALRFYQLLSISEGFRVTEWQHTGINTGWRWEASTEAWRGAKLTVIDEETEENTNEGRGATR